MLKVLFYSVLAALLNFSFCFQHSSALAVHMPHMLFLAFIETLPAPQEKASVFF
jgi:hypothetical protein